MSMDLPWIAVSNTSSVAPYEQVRLQILEAARSGKLPVGSKLPPVRELAKSLGLAANTVARAYRELDEAGVVRTMGRAGTVVTSGGDAVRERIGKAAQEFAQVARAVGYTEAKALSIVKAAMKHTRA